MKSTLRLALTFLLPALSPVPPLGAAELRCTGILGNSGEQGPTLVRFGGNSGEGSMVARGVRGLGVAVDRHGSLWDRGGEGVLNRYSVDGRLLASYPIPAGGRDGDAAVMAGDSLLLLIDHRLHALSIEAPSGTPAADLKIQAEFLSLETFEGRAAAATKDGEIFLVNAAGEKKPLVTLPKPRLSGLALAPDGAVWLRQGDKTLRLPPGAPDRPEEPGGSPGERFQFLDEFCYGHSHHSTVRRFSAELRPAPGVVMGGNSGSFIGHVDEQAEVGLGRGLARAGPGLFAISGQGCILHLLAWREEEARFQPLRRIGAVARCSALALDRAGRVWFRSGSWNWDDGPATPMRSGVPEPEAVFGLTMLESDTVLGYGRLWNKPAVISGGLEKEVKLHRFEEPSQLPADAVAGTVLKLKNQPALVVLGSDGTLSSALIKGEGGFAGDGPAMTLKPAKPVTAWTSLVSPDGETLLAAGDGFVIEFRADNPGAAIATAAPDAATAGGWRETARWNMTGAGNADRFGSGIRLAADAGRLWISDTARQRVLCLDAATHAVIASFGTEDQAGDDLHHLNAPTTLACRGNRAVVFDSGNQRLVKLELLP
ncbi:MAG: hypothetical protein V4726_10980 [Verrucomicrobiota bacterium]